MKQSAHEAVFATPSLGAIAIWLWAIPIEKWAVLLGMIVLALQAAHRLWRWRNEAKDRAAGKPTPITDRAPL